MRGEEVGIDHTDEIPVGIRDIECADFRMVYFDSFVFVNLSPYSFPANPNTPSITLLSSKYGRNCSSLKLYFSFLSLSL